MKLNVQPDKVFKVKTNGEEFDISNGSFDHAVRYQGAIGYLDHLVLFQPIAVPAEDEDTGENGMMYFTEGTRHFLGAVAVETIVSNTGLHEIYATEVTESVYDDYLEQQSGDIGDDIDHILNNFDINTDE